MTAQLHANNLAVRVEEDARLVAMRTRRAPRAARPRAGAPAALEAARVARRRARRGAFEHREVRSYEAEYVHALWYLDFHHGSRQVLRADGTRVTPMLLGLLDDRSRLCCHAQWYLAETAETLVHGLAQAFQKRGLPRAALDNGAPMLAAETREGLLRLGVHQATTLAYSPYQKGDAS